MTKYAISRSITVLLIVLLAWSISYSIRLLRRNRDLQDANEILAAAAKNRRRDCHD